MSYKLLLYCSLILLLSACSSLNVQRAQNTIREKMAQNDAKAAMRSIIKSTDKGYYSAKDEVLMKLELGTTAYLSGAYDSSILAFNEAELRMNELVTRSASRGLASVIGNDNQLEYDGTDFEQIYVNALNSLNFLHQSNMEGAAVEIRKMTFKLAEMQRKFNDNKSDDITMDLLSQQSDKINWSDPKIQQLLGNTESRIRNPAFARYLATVVYAKNQDPDGARIEYENLQKALIIQDDLSWGDLPNPYELSPIQDPTAYNVLLIAFTGESPQLMSFEYRDLIQTQNDNTIYVKFALPEMQLMPISAAYVDVQIDDLSPIRLPLIEHTDEVRKEFFQQKKATIYARSIARSTAKTIGVEALKKAVENKEENEEEDSGNELAREAMASIFGFLLKEGTEQADLRSWQSLPAKIHATTVLLAPGKHKLNYRFYTVDQELLDVIKKEINVPKVENVTKQLVLNEVFLWN